MKCSLQIPVYLDSCHFSPSRIQRYVLWHKSTIFSSLGFLFRTDFGRSIVQTCLLACVHPIAQQLPGWQNWTGSKQNFLCWWSVRCNLILPGGVPRGVWNHVKTMNSHKPHSPCPVKMAIMRVLCLAICKSYRGGGRGQFRTASDPRLYEEKCLSSICPTNS